MTTQPAPTQAHPSRMARPSGRPWWVAAAVVIVVGLIAAGIWLAADLAGLATRPEQFARTSLPGSVTLVMAEGATSTLYVESTDPQAAAQVAVTVRGPDGSTVPATRVAQTVVYDVPKQPGRLGYAGYTVDAAAPGSYVVTGTSAGLDGTATLAVGVDLGKAATRAFLAPAILALGVVVLALVLAATPIARARRDDR